MNIVSLQLPELPITEVLEEINQNLEQHWQLVLEAPPGAGKTTLVPLAILKNQSASPEKSWLGQQRILMLEPRRMAARTAAMRMAELLGEPVGQTIGYRVRQETKISRQSRIEVITEGILSRMLVQDPSLSGVGLLIFDEFHERSLDADLGLAFALQGREFFRDETDPLRILVMSATLDGRAIATLLDRAAEQRTCNHPTPIISSQGKQFPVTIHYAPKNTRQLDIVAQTVATLRQVSATPGGDILVFLPGYAEINRVRRQFSESLSVLQTQQLRLLPLYGALEIKQQQKAIEPLSRDDRNSGIRKIVLATDIAETSLTIAGITTVIDSGLCRQPTFNPVTGVTRLQTKAISQDSSVQRMGRAGRLESGHCFRLWSEEQQKGLSKHSPPEILQADLAGLALQLLAWGITQTEELAWLDLPPKGSLSQALGLLEKLGAVTPRDSRQAHNHRQSTLQDWVLTAHGNQLATLPLHPRLGHMLLCSRAIQQQENASALAALLTERSPLTRYNHVDITEHVSLVRGNSPAKEPFENWRKRAQRQAKTFEQQLSQLPPATTATANQSTSTSTSTSVTEHNVAGYLLACAYPDRVARRKSIHSNHYLLSNGRTALLDPADPCCQFEWLAAADVSGGSQNNTMPNSHNHNHNNSTDRIYSACPLDARLFDNALQSLTRSHVIIHWDESTDRFSAEKVIALGAITLKTQCLEKIPTEAKTDALVTHIRKRGLNLLPWTPATRQWQARVTLLANTTNRKGREPCAWPDVSDTALLDKLEDWLAPHLNHVSKGSDIAKLDLQSILNTLLPWPLPQQLAKLAPLAIAVPSGHQAPIDYSQSPPVLNVKLQEMFGCKTTPTIAEGQIALIVQLLSPARRPLQVTQDLEGFWKTGYHDVKKEMKGRYPKHPWPDNPLDAVATKHTKHYGKKT